MGGRWDLALALLSHLPERQLEPTVVSYNSALNALQTGGQRWTTMRFLQDFHPASWDFPLKSMRLAVATGAAAPIRLPWSRHGDPQRGHGRL